MLLVTTNSELFLKKLLAVFKLTLQFIYYILFLLSETACHLIKELRSNNALKALFPHSRFDINGSNIPAILRHLIYRDILGMCTT